MNYPLLSEYIEAIKAAEDNFEELKHLRPVLGEDGEPVFSSGNFAVVFKMKDEQTGKLHAVKCFLKEQEGRAEAYRLITEELKNYGKVIGSWSFLDFRSNYSKVKRPKFVKKSTGEIYSKLAFEKSDGEYLFVDWSQKLGELTNEELKANVQNLKIVELEVDDETKAKRKKKGIQQQTYEICEKDSYYVSSTYFTHIKYLEKELFVDTTQTTETEFPVLLMDWVEGQTLDKYIREHIDDQNKLSLLAYQFSRLAMWLMPQPLAHGDLKPDNILVKEDGTLVLVDYDGMYVPAMKGQRARELGSPDFRHPLRTEDVFDEHIDDFSLVSILLSLKAIALQPELLEQYGASDRLLFSEKDYRNLSKSQVMDAIKTMMQDAELATLYSLFILSSAQNNLSQASFKLLNLKRPQVPDSTLVADVGLANDIKDLNEFVYTKVKQCASKLLLSLEDEQIEELDKKLLYIELTMLSAASVLDVLKEKDNWREFFEQMIFNDYVSNKDVEDYDYWIESNTPCMSVFNIYTVDNAISLTDFEKENGQVKFFRGNINTCRYDEHFWGEFIDKNGKKQIIYVDQGFPFEYNVSDLLKNKSEYGIVKEKDTYYHSDNIFYCLKRIKQKHSCIPSYIKERLSFYEYYINDALSNEIINKTQHSILLYHTVIHGMLNFDEPSGNPEDMMIEDDAILNCRTGTQSPYNETSLNKFSMCIWESLSNLRNELDKNNPEENLCTEVTDEDLINGKEILLWGGGIYSPDNSRLLVAPKNVKSFSVGNGVRIICDGAFNRCFNLELVDIPDSVISIGKVAFSHCFAIKELSIPNSVIEIGEHAFSYCENLQYISLSNGIKRIGNSLFSNCHHLEDISIPNGVVEIEANAFFSCERLEKIWIPDTVSTIDRSAFIDCKKLAYIFIPANTINRFEGLLPEYREILNEQVTIEKHEGLKRVFSTKELDIVKNAKVVQGTCTIMVCFYMNDGCQKYIPLSKESNLSIGDEVDLSAAKLIEFTDEGIYYGLDVDGEYYSKYLVEV